MKQIFYTLLFIFSASSLVAQPEHKEIEERLESRRVAYITQELNLTVEEAQAFWPIYNAHRKEVKTLREAHKMQSDDRAKRSLSDIFSHEEKDLELKKNYASQVVDIIGEERTIHLITSERRFRERMIRGIQSKTRSGGRRGGFQSGDRGHRGGN